MITGSTVYDHRELPYSIIPYQRLYCSTCTTYVPYTIIPYQRLYSSTCTCTCIFLAYYTVHCTHAPLSERVGSVPDHTESPPGHPVVLALHTAHPHQVPLPGEVPPAPANVTREPYVSLNYTRMTWGETQIPQIPYMYM